LGRIQRWSTDFIVTGDVVCAFNPIYGQGMTVSAMMQEQKRSSRAAPALLAIIVAVIAHTWFLVTKKSALSHGEVEKRCTRTNAGCVCCAIIWTRFIRISSTTLLPSLDATAYNRTPRTLEHN
jgi:hypothetical protein